MHDFMNINISSLQNFFIFLEYFAEIMVHQSPSWLIYVYESEEILWKKYCV